MKILFKTLFLSTIGLTINNVTCSLIETSLESIQISLLSFIISYIFVKEMKL